MRKERKKVMGIVMSLAVCFSGLFVTAPAKAEEVDLDGTYHAALAVSTATQKWINRNGYFDESANSSYGTDNYEHLIAEDSDTGETVVYDGTFTDVEIKGNGTYTVKLEGADFSGETTICMLHIPTDIPVTDQITFTNVSAKINGKTVLEFDEAFMEDEEPYLGGGMDIILLNHWREALVNQLNDSGIQETSSNGYDFLLGTGDETIEVTFTVNGFNYDKEVEETPSPETSETSDEEESITNATITYLVVVVAAIVVIAAVCIILVVRKRKK